MACAFAAETSAAVPGSALQFPKGDRTPPLFSYQYTIGGSSAGSHAWPKRPSGTSERVGWRVSRSIDVERMDDVCCVEAGVQWTAWSAHRSS